MFGKFTLFKRLVKKVWQINRSAKGILILTTNLDGFSLVKCKQFAKFIKLSTCQTFPLYCIRNLPCCYIDISKSGQAFSNQVKI